MAAAAKYVLALDQGTTSSRAILFNHAGEIVAKSQREFPQHYPQPGWVEHDPEEIWNSQIGVARDVVEKSGADLSEIAAVGITNQRETTIVWDRVTGEAIYNAIVWQDRQTAVDCDRLKLNGFADTIRAKTGLVIDPYFSATKLRWLLDNVEGARDRANRGDLLFGTVDSFLIWRLTSGRLHITDVSNASRTMLFNIPACSWDEELLALFDIPPSILPQVRQTSEVYGRTSDGIFGQPGSLPIASAVGDQQAATFGQTCFTAGQSKNTYGTGCFLMMNTGSQPVDSTNGLLTTIGWSINGNVTYCLEGGVFVGGAVIQYLRDSLGIIASAAESEALALSVASNGGVYFVPAFVGLGAPHWDAHARGAMFGLTRGSGRGEIARAALESVAYQSRDLLDAMAADAGSPVTDLRVDGGMVANNFLMQFQADILGTTVARPVVAETTALGAAYLAGLATGFWRSQEEITQNWKLDRLFEPSMDATERTRLYSGWRRAVARSRDWEEPG